MTGWRIPASHPELRPGDVHLWRIDLRRNAGEVEARASLLAPDERERMQSYRFDVHRERFALRRGAMRMLLGRYLGIDPRQVAFQYSARGKPELVQMLDGAALRFNLTDSEDLALLAVTLDDPVGVDVEHIRYLPEMDDLAQRFFSPREHAAYLSLDPAARQAGFYNCWTRKEAWLKARGDGLSWNLAGFDVTLAPGSAARLERVEGAPGEPAQWSFDAGTPWPSYIAALAVRSREPQVVFLEFGEAVHTQRSPRHERTPSG